MTITVDFATLLALLLGATITQTADDAEGGAA
jgi:hypothetical protein